MKKQTLNAYFDSCSFVNLQQKEKKKKNIKKKHVILQESTWQETKQIPE